MSRMNNEKGLGMTDEEIIAELHKKIGLYQIGMASEIDKRERVIVEAKEIIEELCSRIANHSASQNKKQRKNCKYLR